MQCAITLADRKARLIHIVDAVGCVFVLETQLRRRLEPRLYGLFARSFVPCTICLAISYALDARMPCAETIEPALTDVSWVGRRQPRDLVAILADFLGYCYRQGW